MGWRQPGPGSAGAFGRNKILRMKTKRNRYDLSLWDVRKLSLYGRPREGVQAATLVFASYGRSEATSLIVRWTSLGHRPWGAEPNHRPPVLGRTNSTSTKTE